MPMDFSFIEDADLRATAETNYATDVTAQTAATQVLIDESISGLKEKNTQLLDEKKTIQKTLKNFDGLDPEAAKEALKFLEGNEDAQLIKDGKIEELLDRKTSTMRTEHETAVEGLSESLLTATESGKKYKGLYESKLLDDSLTTAAIAAKVESTAIADIILNGKGIFSISEDGSVEARDKDGKVLKTSDGKVLTTTNWVEEKRASSPHWWGKSESGDLTPGGDPDDYAAALARAAASGDTKKFRALRKKAKA